MDKIWKLKNDSLEARSEPGEAEEMSLEEKEKFRKWLADREISEGNASSGVDEKGGNGPDTGKRSSKDTNERKSKRVKTGAKKSGLDAGIGFAYVPWIV